MAERRNGLTVVIVAADTDLAVVDFDWARALSTCSRARGPLVKARIPCCIFVRQTSVRLQMFLSNLDILLGAVS